ncbi:unnamed protein product [Clonostachys chloroleuca]|uniref:Uncharacterized protein n=1 Tax=Clonostachys chloroleuca TaxID=1926264 RepID=A0AA35MEZ5_9HYPO|nr:unnamed protein product [Clonostachys chloroleuca]CAI6091451.1 unnamed protein product [Clonostachys chloroleuca]CAI6095861.1 unnamed protein product [Clonostachys chloroleuca]
MGERWDVYNHATVSFVIEVMHRWGNQAALPTGPGSHWPTEAGHDDTVLEPGSPRGSAGAYDEGGFVVKWTQMEVEEYNMAHFKIQCMLFNTVESRLSEKRWVLEFVVDSISGDDITLHADFYSGSGG